MEVRSNFVELQNSNNIWAIGSIHSNLNSFISIQKHIYKNFKKNDKIIFLGNVIGVGDKSKDVLSSLIDFRNELMSKFLLMPQDLVFLRGAQEEMFLKLSQLQTAPNPYEIVKWMFEHGVDKTISSYNLDPKNLYEISTQGTLSISKWTSKLNKVIEMCEGHKEYFSNLKHAAYSESKKILFVNRGVDISRPLSVQSDCFWWGYRDFTKIEEPYNTFLKIVRGYEPNLKEGSEINKKIVCSLYRGPLNNGKIIGGLFNDSSEVIDLFESN